jgi:DeoR/GlpR family transcriptional regulator of sugar metabolism
VNWYTQHRQEWIADMLHVYGFINRKHLERKFGISTQQASYDLKVFQKTHPEMIEYDAHLKHFKAK